MRLRALHAHHGFVQQHACLALGCGAEVALRAEGGCEQRARQQL
tara:strand:+ start:1538 stop:1669 length:132 start_codon:yes stop_codon:yes gene_type:complete